MTLLPGVRRQLYEAADRRSTRRWRRLVSRLTAGGRGRGPVLVLAVLLGTGAVAYAAGQLIPGGSAKYADEAMHELIARDPACGSSGLLGHLSDRSPSPRLLAMLGVLRRPATSQDAFPPTLPLAGRRIVAARRRELDAYRRRHHLPIRPAPTAAQRRQRVAGFGGDVYVRYIRRARVAFGQVYYVIPSGNWQVETIPAKRCLSELRSDLPRMTTPERRVALRLVRRSLINERAINQPHEALCLDAIQLTGPSIGVGGGGCGTSDSQLKQGQGFDTQGGTKNSPSIVSALVPDSVATITLTFASKKSNDHRSLSVTTRPVENVMAVRVPSSAASSNPQTLVWRSSTGHVLRTIARS